MIDYQTYTLDNGLTVVLNHDPKRTVAVVNVLYKVGSKHDPPGRTGLAHLFEHLMFAGSANVEDFDEELERAGGDNNAMTGQDYTLYYDTVPWRNLDTALWLEADRMRELNFSPRVLATQKKVVVEEFKETCLEEPYGDFEHHLNGLVYPNSAYRWPVIGDSFADIEATTLEEIKDFFYRYYRPNNAILVVAGHYDPATIRQRIQGYFGDIEPSVLATEAPTPRREPEQQDFRAKTVCGDVPSPILYRHFRTAGRTHPDFPALAVLSYLLGGGRSSILYRRLIRDSDHFTEINCGLIDNIDAGGLLIEAKPAEDVELDVARRALSVVLENIALHGVPEDQLTKAVHHLEHRSYYRDLNIEGRAAELAIFTLLGDTNLINTETDRYLGVQREDIKRVARQYLSRTVTTELDYLVEQQQFTL